MEWGRMGWGGVGADWMGRMLWAGCGGTAPAQASKPIRDFEVTVRSDLAKVRLAKVQLAMGTADMAGMGTAGMAGMGTDGMAGMGTAGMAGMGTVDSIPPHPIPSHPIPSYPVPYHSIPSPPIISRRTLRTSVRITSPSSI